VVLTDEYVDECLKHDLYLNGDANDGNGTDVEIDPTTVLSQANLAHLLEQGNTFSFSNIS
jgi:hypothetical protein